jgi:hypothetical protein
VTSRPSSFFCPSFVDLQTQEKVRAQGFSILWARREKKLDKIRELNFGGKGGKTENEKRFFSAEATEKEKNCLLPTQYEEPKPG